MGNSVQKIAYSGPYPESFGTPTFDPQYGFTGERKKRVMPVSEDVLVDAQIPLKDRDYCVHLYLDYLKCYRDQFPFVQRCRNELFAYHQCGAEDNKLRMMEYERERRLLFRKQRKEKMLKAEGA